MPNATCAARRFCACTDCRTLGFDVDGGTHRGNPISTDDERTRTRTDYKPTHRKDS